MCEHKSKTLSYRYGTTFQEILIASSIVVFAAAAGLKIASSFQPTAVMLSTGIGMLPTGMMTFAIIVEMTLVICLLTPKISNEQKLQLLAFVAISLIGFRLLTYGPALVVDCGCFGSASGLRGDLAKAFNGIGTAVLYIMPFGYVTYIFGIGNPSPGRELGGKISASAGNTEIRGEVL
jgi:hypothetical protein